MLTEIKIFLEVCFQVNSTEEWSSDWHRILRHLSRACLEETRSLEEMGKSEYLCITEEKAK